MPKVRSITGYASYIGFFDGALQHGFQDFVDYLNLAIGPRVIGSFELMTKTKERRQLFKDFILEMFAVVRDQLFWDSKT